MKKTVLHMLEESAGRFPEKTALADEYRSFSYREYLFGAVETARRIGRTLWKKETFSLRDFGMRKEDRNRPIGVFIDQNALSVIAFLGVAYSGHFYVPLDPAQPAERLKCMLEKLDPVMLLDAREKPGKEPGEETGEEAGEKPGKEPGKEPGEETGEKPGKKSGKEPGALADLKVSCDLPVLTMRSILEDSLSGDEQSGDVFFLKYNQSGDGPTMKDGKSEDAASLASLLADARLLRAGIREEDPLYAIFTSGSTGVPKAVLIAHRSVADLTEAFEEAFSFAEDTVFGNQAPFDFDVSVKDIYNALHCKGRVEILPRRLFVMPAGLMDYLSERGINTLIWAVSALRILSDLHVLEETDSKRFPRLRYVMFSGEVMPVRTVRDWIRTFPETVFVNLYGPTEITCNCTYFVLDRHFEDDEAIPIGGPFANARVYLQEFSGEDFDEGEEFDEVKKDSAKAPGSWLSRRVISPSEKGVRGEICVEGSGVALGYWNDPERTEECFARSPGMSGESGGANRIYRTRDLGYYNSRKELVFAVRADSQIKHMGHRIEPGEIEAALSASGLIDGACCFYDRDREKIVCVYQAREEQRMALIKALSVRLPKYMRPNVYLRVDRLPLNGHGKIDRPLLRTMYEEGRLREQRGGSLKG